VTGAADHAAVLEIEGLTGGYADLTVLHDVALTVTAGEVVAVLGPNGAGKTTLLLTVAGILPSRHGRISVLGVEGSHRSVHRQIRRGLAFVPSERGLFPGLSVRENIRIRTRDRTAVARAVALFPRLEGLLSRRAGLLSGGEQQMLALAAALVTRPRLLLIDEMSMGLAPTVVRSLLPVIRTVTDEEGMGVLLVEQHAPAAVEVSDRVVVMNQGRVVHEGPSHEVRDDPVLLRSLYLAGAPAT